MSYIGNVPTNVAFLTDTFNGTGSTTAFTLSAAPANTNSILVAVSGVLQDPSTYSISGTALNFSAAPPSGTGNISVRFLGIPASGIVNTAYRTQTEFTATAGQTTFSVPSYTVGFIDVYRNGALLGSADFTATNGTTVVLTAGASAGDLVETISFSVSSVLNAIPATNGAVTSAYLLDGSVTKAKMAASGAWAPTGTVIQVVQGDLSTTFSTTNSSPTDTGLSATITPSSTSSKILALLDAHGGQSSGNRSCFYYLVRGSTTIKSADNLAPTLSNFNLPMVLMQLDSPSTASAVTYKIQMATDGVGTVTMKSSGTQISSLILMEIAG
jgi:hypothetical protein